MATYIWLQMHYGLVRGLSWAMRHWKHLTSMHSFTSTSFQHLTHMRLCKNAFPYIQRAEHSCTHPYQWHGWLSKVHRFNATTPSNLVDCKHTKNRMEKKPNVLHTHTFKCDSIKQASKHDSPYTYVEQELQVQRVWFLSMKPVPLSAAVHVCMCLCVFFATRFLFCSLLFSVLLLLFRAVHSHTNTILTIYFLFVCFE